MINVSEFLLEWPRPMQVLNISSQASQRLAKSARIILSGSLTKLALCGTISEIARVVALATLQELTELEIVCRFNTAARRNKEESLIVLAPFINRFKNTLRSLTIYSSASVDHSAFFGVLWLRSLEKLSVRLYLFDKAHLSDPSGLGRLLTVNQSTLINLEFQVTAEGRLAKECPTSLIILQRYIVNNARLARLRSLSIPCFDFPTTLDMIRQASKTLKKICLTRPGAMTPKELNEVAALFKGRTPVSVEFATSDGIFLT
ncbi:hypothetical protein H0H81_000115 [Sphagnurus paluster]|uniref:Uncharacterized protein n=1 Tax=Sphagnurus paluster TaxID=117069 RepID=A0A9P7GNV0_9AGAR|nr:hypothetical protein H0H81_000115 [Sphagnurus paluster]